METIHPGSAVGRVFLIILSNDVVMSVLRERLLGNGRMT